MGNVGNTRRIMPILKILFEEYAYVRAGLTFIQEL